MNDRTSSKVSFFIALNMAHKLFNDFALAMAYKLAFPPDDTGHKNSGKERETVWIF